MPTPSSPATPQPKKHDRQVAAFALLYILALMTCGWLGYYFWADYAVSPVKEIRPIPARQAYVEMPRLSLQLPSDDSHKGMVQMEIALQVDRIDATRVAKLRPRINDRFISYTEKLNYDDLAKPQSILWLKPQLLQIAHEAGAPQIHDIIFRQFVVL